MTEIILEKPLNNFKNNISKIDKLVSIGSDVSDITVNLLEDLLKKYESIPGFLEFKSKLEQDINLIKNIKNNPLLKDKYAAIYQQALVLIVSNFESFLSELSITAFDEYAYMVKWPEKKLSLDLEVFKYSTQTVGEIVMRSIKEKYSFQDLQAMINFFDEYFGFKLDINNDLRNKIVLCHAKRHSLIHNLGRVDDKFLKQVREIKGAHMKFSKGDSININENEYLDAKQTFIGLAEKISSEMFQKSIPF